MSEPVTALVTLILILWLTPTIFRRTIYLYRFLKANRNRGKISRKFPFSNYDSNRDRPEVRINGRHYEVLH